jgi:vitellogenic carboxypeptidase-like protein
LLDNPYAWSKDHSVIYIDNPVGTGFSYTGKTNHATSSFVTKIVFFLPTFLMIIAEDPADYPLFIEDSTEDLFEFLQQFFLLFPEHAASPFYAFGESYGGKYAPAIALKIHEENLEREEGKLVINLGMWTCLPL